MELNKIFKDGLWSSEINVRDFVSHNITPYYGDASFLEGPTERTKAVWNRCLEALAEERENLVFILWGAYAQKKGAFIDRNKHLVLASAHPSPLSAYNGFFGNKHFSRANEYLTAHGQQPIQW